MKGKIICNKCGKTFDTYDDTNYFHIHRRAGYGMGKYDGEIIWLDLCCDCMKELIEKCKIPPIEEKRDFYTPDSEF